MTAISTNKKFTLPTMVYAKNVCLHSDQIWPSNCDVIVRYNIYNIGYSFRIDKQVLNRIINTSLWLGWLPVENTCNYYLWIKLRK